MDQLIASRREFVAFVARRVGDQALAEDIVQDAMAKSLERSGEVRESAVGWFYRVLRNAIIDRARRAAVAEKRLAAFAAELDATPSDDDMQRFACQCVLSLAKTLKPEYADAIEKVDLQRMPVKAYADALGISASNAGVRLFRARDALRKQVALVCGVCATHGCTDCGC